MLNVLIAIYRANPFRPHCSGTRHVPLCRVLLRSQIPPAPGSRCPAKDA